MKARDPRLAGLLSQVYGDGDWRFPATAPGKFDPWASSHSGDEAAAAAVSGVGGSKRQRRSRDDSKQATAAAAVAPQAAAAAPQQQREQEEKPLQVPVLMEQPALTQPLLKGRGGSGVGGVSRRRRAGSPGRQGGAGGSKLGAVPRRITRAFALLTGCCFGGVL